MRGYKARLVSTIEELNALDPDVDVTTKQGETFKAWQLQETASNWRNMTLLIILPATVKEGQS